MGCNTTADHGVYTETLVQLLEYTKTDTEAYENEAKVNEFWGVGVSSVWSLLLILEGMRVFILTRSGFDYI